MLSRGRHPPSPSHSPPPPVTSGLSGPAPWRARDQSAEGAGFRGEGRGQGPRESKGGPRKRQRKEGVRRVNLACPPPPHPEPGTPLFTSLSSGISPPLVSISDFFPCCLGNGGSHLQYPHPSPTPSVSALPSRPRSASRELSWPYAANPGGQGAVRETAYLSVAWAPLGCTSLWNQPLLGWGMGFQNQPEEPRAWNHSGQ